MNRTFGSYMQIQCLSKTQHYFGSSEYHHIQKDQPIQVSISYDDNRIHDIDAYSSTDSNWQQVLMLMRQLSQQKRWVIWIAPPKRINIAILNHYKINLSRILMVHPGAKNREQLIERALQSQSCSAVFCWEKKLTKTQLQ